MNEPVEHQEIIREFQSCVIAAFEWLGTRFGAERNLPGAGWVRYNLPTVSVMVFRDERSYLVGLEVGLHDAEERFNLYEILSALAPSEATHTNCCGPTVERMSECITRVSTLFQEHCLSLLSADHEDWQKVRQTAGRLRGDATLQGQFGAIRDRAAAAWENKVWDSALSLLNQAREALNDTELRRLAYLEQQRGRSMPSSE